MTDDELTVLMIAAQGESMIPIGRWEVPILSLTTQGLMRRNDGSNYSITEKGIAAVRREESERDGAFAKALKDRQQRSDTMHVDMTILGKQVVFDLTYDPNFVADFSTKTF